MLGRKAILHGAAGGGSAGSKRKKWQIENDKDSDGESSVKFSEEEEDEGDAASLLEAADGIAPKAPKASKASKVPVSNGAGGAGSPQPDAASLAAEEPPAKQAKQEEQKGADEDSDDEDGGGGKAFAWMDSDDEVSEGKDEEEEAPKAAKAATPAKTALPLAVGRQPQLATGAKLLATLRLPSVGFCPALALPPGTVLPVLSQEHLVVMAQIASAKTLTDFWELAERRAQDFAAAHAAFGLHRLSQLAAGGALATEATPDLAVERHKSFARLRDRLDELLATAKGRASFLTADLAMVASSLSKVVPLPATEGATGRIFADIADEAESRLVAEPAAFTTSMLADLAWGLSKSGNSCSSLLRSIVDVVVPRLAEASCQDIATLSSAFALQMFDEAEVLLHGVFQQVKQRLAYRPPLPIVTAMLTALPAASPAAQGALQIAAGLGAPGVPVMTPPMMTPPGVPAMSPPVLEPPAGDAATASEGSSSGGRDLPAWQLVGHWRFSCAQISDVAYAAGKRSSLYDEALFSLVAQQFTQRLVEATAQQLQKLREAFEIIRHDVQGDFMRALRSAQLLPKNRSGFQVNSGQTARPANLLDARDARRARQTGALSG